MEKDKLLKDIGFSQDLIDCLKTSNEKINNAVFNFHVHEIEQKFIIDHSMTGDVIVSVSNKNYAKDNLTIK